MERITINEGNTIGEGTSESQKNFVLVTMMTNGKNLPAAAQMFTPTPSHPSRKALAKVIIGIIIVVIKVIIGIIIVVVMVIIGIIIVVVAKVIADRDSDDSD